jgi:quercetin dioxygenase-like cupin family protein
VSDGILDQIRGVQNGDLRLWGQPTGSLREVVRFEERAALDIRGGVRWERLTPTPLAGTEFLELIYAPGAESDSQAYRHPGIELVLVTTGSMTIFLGFDRHDLRPGDSIAFPSSTPHRYVNLTDNESRAVTVILRDDLSNLPMREESPTGDASDNR